MAEKALAFPVQGLAFGEIDWNLLEAEDRGYNEKEISGALDTTTSQRAELIAIIEGLKALNRRCRVKVYSDSQVAVYCARGDYNRNSNTDLWAVFDELDQLHSVEYIWIRGRNGDPYNERAHLLAARQIDAH